MEGISIPLKINRKGLVREKNVRKSITSFLDFLIRTTKYTCVPDPEFGFILNNLRFEAVSEAEGVIHRDLNDRLYGDDSVYGKKISGTSSNRDTFAYELKSVIDIYEKRLSAVKVTMTYIRQSKAIHISIKGKLVEDESDYQFATDIKVWN